MQAFKLRATPEAMSQAYAKGYKDLKWAETAVDYFEAFEKLFVLWTMSLKSEVVLVNRK